MLDLWCVCLHYFQDVRVAHHVWLCLQILLSLWGPVVVSVGNLLTIVLVFVSDILFGAGMSAVTIWSVVGSVGIMAAFGVLVTAGV